jgi:hypothetical protein
MQITSEALQEFKEICRSKFDRELSDTEAHDAATRVIRFLLAMEGCGLPPIESKPHSRRSNGQFQKTISIIDAAKNL